LGQLVSQGGGSIAIEEHLEPIIVAVPEQFDPDLGRIQATGGDPVASFVVNSLGHFRDRPGAVVIPHTMLGRALIPT
jgi:hypothetical protein